MNKLAAAPPGAEQFVELGKTQSETTLNLQKELLEAYAQVSRGWLARAQSEMELWSQLASRVAASRSIPEALNAYQTCLSQRAQMAMDDSRRLFADSQEIMTKIAKSLPNSWAGAITVNNLKNRRGERL